MKYIPVKLTVALGRQILIAKKHSPTILFVAGSIGAVTSAGLACRSTLKVHDVMDKHRKTALDIRTVEHVQYSEQDRRKDMTILYMQTTMEFTKLYGPSLLLGAASLASLAGAHNILSKRNVALTAAYAAVEKSYKEYRERVVGEFGEDKDRELRHGVVTETIEVEENGKLKKRKVKALAPDGPSMYAVKFDQRNVNWDPRADYNIMFLRTQQNWANDTLMARGHIFLNEVYDLLGMPHTTPGAVTGWVKGNGDNQVDFGIFADGNRSRLHQYINNNDGSILLDFNVDGVVYDLI